MIANSTDSTQSMGARRSGPTAHPVRVGPYRILGLLGEGGMGIVYHAEQTAPIHRHVALKLIRPGMDSGEVLARFASERQALALLNHPGIARVYEAGSTRLGRPYFVMEYVQGMPITDYCDRYRLTNSDRLGLFMQTCAAIQHAHSKGIIHRDVKPSNVLVTEVDNRPVPKIIDFGVAKAVEQRLAPGTVYTGVGQLLGTPEYMSPEQAEMTGLDVDHRTDVYSLGVLLYELLVGALPFESSSLRDAGQWEIQRIIREQEPLKPSTRLSSLGDQSTLVAERRRTDLRSLRRELRGDLDWIVMKALEKDRTRRYGSCSEFAADVQRHLNGEPVVARPPSAGYKLAKFARKRRLGLAASAVLVILCGLTAFFIASARHSTATARSERVKSLFAEARWEAHSTPEDALRLFSQLLEMAPQMLEAKIEYAFLLRRLNHYDEATRLCEEVIHDHPTKAGPAHILLAQVLDDLNPGLAADHRAKAAQLLPRDDYYRALALPREQSNEAIKILTEVLRGDPINYIALWARAWRRHDVGDYEGMLRDAEELTLRWPETASYWNAKGMALSELGRLDESIRAYDEFLNRRPGFARVLLNRANAYTEMALASADTDAERLYEQALADIRAAGESEPPSAQFHATLAYFHYLRNSKDEAWKECEKALSLDPALGLALRCKGLLLVEKGRDAEALTAMENGLARSSGKAADYHLRGVLRRNSGRIFEALADHDRALSWQEKKPIQAKHHVARGITRRFAGDPLGAMNDFSRAIELNPQEWSVQCSQWIWEIHMLSRVSEAIAAETALSSAENKADDDLEHKMIGVCRGTVDETEILKEASSEKLRGVAHYYLGVRARIEQRDVAATEHFHRCKTLGGDTPEAEMSPFHLQQLGHGES